MPRIELYNKVGKRLHAQISGLDKFPSDVHSILIDREEGSHDGAVSIDYESLTRMVMNTSKKLHEITITFERNQSPEYLAFLVATFNNTERLSLCRCFSHPAEFYCLVAGLLPSHGLRELDLNLTQDPVEGIEDLLLQVFEGVAFSSLVKFELASICDLTEHNLGNALIQALRTNRTLKILDFNLSWGQTREQMLQKVFYAVVHHTQVTDLCLVGTGPTEAAIDNRVWVDALCCSNCNIEKLDLCGIRLHPGMDSGDNSEDQLMFNASVKDLSVVDGDLNCIDTAKIMRRFKSLHSLNVEENDLGSMSLFEDLLLGNEPLLQSLSVSFNPIDEAGSESFVKKLPLMRSLKHLEINFVSFMKSASGCASFEAAFFRSASIEYLDYEYGRWNGERPWKEYYNEAICVPLSLNRGGRRYLQGDSRRPISESLWPHVLERAGKILYYAHSDEWKEPSLESTRADVVYWLLREKMLV